MNTNVLGQNIKFFRKRRGMTQEELALEIQKSKNIVPRWERGEIQPTAKNISLLAEALGVTPSELLEDTFTKQSEYSDRTKIKSNTPTMAYWGSVLDNAKKAAENGENLPIIINILSDSLKILKNNISTDNHDTSIHSYSL